MSLETSLERLNVAQQLHETGRHTRLVEFLRSEPKSEVDESPTLAVLYGISHAHLGAYDEAWALATTALHRARDTGDPVVETRALNTLGAIAFQCGRIDEAETYFEKGQDAAHETNDAMSIGRCANNLGVIATLRGDYSRAIASLTRALATFEQSGSTQGVAETLNNMSISYRDQRDYTKAVDCGERAIEAAGESGDRALFAYTLAGRAETRVHSGDARVARREAEASASIHRELHNIVGESEAQRVVALTHIETGDFAGGETTLRNVMALATQHGRILLKAAAGRDLANLYYELRRWDEMRAAALTARDIFEQLGAAVEVKNLNELLGAGTN